MKRLRDISVLFPRLAGGVLLLLLMVAAPGCMKWEEDEEELFDAAGSGLFIINEGNFQYGNASLSYYDPATGEVQNDIFSRANGMKLGDVAQSMTVRDGRGWIAVCNSHVIFAIDLTTFRETGRIENAGSPRYIHFVSDRKAYVTQIWDNRIYIIDPQTCSITGYINVPGMEAGTGSTEQMVQAGRYVYCNCWSYQNRLLKIDTETDRVVGELTVGIQPTSVALDRAGRLWTLTDGGYDGSPYGYEAPSLWCVDPESFTVLRQYRFRLGDTPSELQINADGDRLYWLDDDVWCMETDAARLPVRPLLPSRGTRFYGLTVSPSGGEIYVADAIDYQQQGMVSRYSPDGELIDEFYTGVTPSAFCWK